MGRRRRGGQWRAAKVEARRRRRAVTTRPPRRARHERAGVSPTTAPPEPTEPATRGDMATLLGEIVAGLDLEDEWDDEIEDDYDDDLEDDGEDYRFEELEDEVRLAVARTVRERDADVARTLVADAGRSAARPFTGERVLVDLIVDSWLRKAGRRRADADLPHAAVAWVAEHLGEDARRAGTILGPTAPGAWMADFLRTPDDVLVARLWLLAAVVALAPGRDAVRVDVLGGVTP